MRCKLAFFKCVVVVLATVTCVNPEPLADDKYVSSERDDIPVRRLPTTRKPSSICTKSNINYDCMLQDVRLSHNEPNVFGLGWKDNSQKNITFIDSKLQYLPKRLFEAFQEMEMLNAEDLQIEEIEHKAFKYAKKLKTLYLKRNLISNIVTFKGVPLLVSLDLSHNRITFIRNDAFEKNTKLERLLMNHNHISELPGFQNIENLEVVNLANNDLQEISDTQFRDNLMLNSLDASYNQLRHFNLNQLNDKPNLSLISVSFNNLESLYIPVQVQKLDARNNSISNINANICSLQNLYLSNNQIIDISALRNCRSMKILNLSHNKLQSIDLIESMPDLSVLNVAHNQLFEINFPARMGHPLQYLDLSYNFLSFGPTNRFDRMINLKLNNNKLIEFKFDVMIESLKYTTLSENEWNCDKIKRIMQAKREILFDKDETCRNSQAKPLNGICCKNYTRFVFSDHLKEMVREVYVHESVNHKDLENCNPTKAMFGVNQPIVQTMHNKIAELDSSAKEILSELETVQRQIKSIDQEIHSAETKRVELETVNQNYKQLIEQYRENYGIPKQGLFSSSATLERVAKYTQDRKRNSENLLARRTKEVEATNARMESKNLEKVTAKSEDETFTAVRNKINKDESKLKKQTLVLKKSVCKIYESWSCYEDGHYVNDHNKRLKAIVVEVHYQTKLGLTKEKCTQPKPTTGVSLLDIRTLQVKTAELVFSKNQTQQQIDLAKSETEILSWKIENEKIKQNLILSEMQRFKETVEELAKHYRVIQGLDSHNATLNKIVKLTQKRNSQCYDGLLRLKLESLFSQSRQNKLVDINQNAVKENDNLEELLTGFNTKGKALEEKMHALEAQIDS